MGFLLIFMVFYLRSAGRAAEEASERVQRAARRGAKDFDRPRFLQLLMGAFLFWTFAPIAIVVLFSFNSGKSLQNFDGFSTQWYSDFFGDSQLRESLFASLEIALVTMIVATVLGSLLAFGLVRSRNRLSPVTNVMMLVPLVVPEIVAGVSALLIFTQIGMKLSLTTIILAHITFSISYVTVIVRGRLVGPQQRGRGGGDGPRGDPDPDAAARRAAGAVAGDPRCRPAQPSRSASTTSCSRSSPRATSPQPLPVRIYSSIRFGVTPTINAIGTLMLFVSLTTIGAGAGAAVAAAAGGAERADRKGRCMNENGEAIRFEGVTKRFGEIEAVNDMELMIRKGEFFSLLGPSGCGKTTTLRMVAGFEQPSEGAIYLEGEPVGEVPPYRRNVNTVFQSYALFENLDVFENVAFGLKRRKVGKDEISRRVDEALELVQLPSRSDAKPRELSGGQKQRVALARALVNRPSVLLLDEPLGALDLKLRRQMQVELKQIQREVGITFVYVTHDQEEALSMSDRIAVMNAGRIIAVRCARGGLRAPGRGVRRRLHRHLEPDRRASSKATGGPRRLALRSPRRFPRAARRATPSSSRCGPRRSPSTTTSRRAW